MRVWVVETGVYEQREIGGVYSSPEAAMRAFPITPASRSFEGRRAGWVEREDGEWWNQCDWDDSTSIIPFELEGIRQDQEHGC